MRDGCDALCKHVVEKLKGSIGMAMVDASDDHGGPGEDIAARHGGKYREGVLKRCECAVQLYEMVENKGGGMEGVQEVLMV